jgi:hypothetical protein
MSTETLHRETREVILKNIEKKDRRFRLFQGAFIVLIFISLVGILLIQQATLNNVKKELAQQQSTVAEVKKSSDTINRHLDCIIVYFGQKNRSELTIQDINNCTLQNSTGVQQFFTPTSGSDNGGQTQLSPGSTQISPGNTTAPSNSPSSTNLSNPSPTKNTTPVATPTPTQPDPRKILGIPVCIPFTGVCVR